MQTLNDIREKLDKAGLAPQKRFGQSFLVDLNLMRKILEFADLNGSETVLEVGPGTGSLTEELLKGASRVVAVEIDHGLCKVLRENFAKSESLTLIEGDVLSGKHAIAPEVLGAVGEKAAMVANLPYNIATPLIALCLLSSWHASKDGEKGKSCLFEKLTFTVQKEVADRLGAIPGNKHYGPVSILVSLLGKVTQGPVLPPSAFWPPPKVASQILHIEFDFGSADKLADVDILSKVLSLAFGQRRKQIHSMVKRKNLPCTPEQLAQAMEASGIAPKLRAENIPAQQYRDLSNWLAKEVAQKHGE